MEKFGDKELRYVVNEVCEVLVNEYLDSKLMAPLRDYLKRGRKKYTWSDLDRMYRSGKNINTRMAFQDQEVFKNGWVLHFTNKPLQIIANGFTGIDREYMEIIWRTYGRPFPRVPEGYAFAFDAHDLLPSNAIDYGKYALMFRVSGLKVGNLGDAGQKQVIFNSKMANLKDCFLLRFDTDREVGFDGNGDADGFDMISGVSVINPYTRKAVYKTDDIKKAIEWVETNGRQYGSTGTFNNAGRLKALDAQSDEIMGKTVEYFKANFNGRYAIGPVYNNGNYSYLYIVYENTTENSFRIRPFIEYFNSIKNDYVSCEAGTVSDLLSIDIWKDKYGDSPVNSIFGGDSYYDLYRILLTKTNTA